MKVNIKFWQVLVIGIFIWGVMLRAPEVLSKNFLFGYDNGRDFMIVRDMVENHKLRLIGAEAGSGSAALKGLFHGPGYYYILALSYLLFRGDPYGALLIMFLFGVTTMFLTYFLTYKMFGRTTAIAALFLVSVSDLIVSQSRFIWGPHPIYPFILLSLYFLYRMNKRLMPELPLSLFFAACTYHFHIGVAVPMVLSILISAVFVYRVKSVKNYLLSFGAIVFGFFPIILFELRHNFLALSNIFFYFTDNTYTKAGITLDLVKNHLMNYWFNFINTFIFQFSPVPVIIQTLIVLLFLIIGIRFVIKEKNKDVNKFISSLIIMVIVSFLFFFQLKDTIWDFYLLHNRMIYVLFFAYFTSKILVIKTKQKILNISILILSCFYIAVFIGSIKRMHVSYTQDFFEKPIYQKISGKKAIIDYIYNDAKDIKFNIIIFVPYIHAYPYQYLLRTYAVDKYGKEVGDHKSGLVYMVIENSNEQQLMKEDWINKNIVGSELISQKEILSDLIVQKRFYK